MKTNKETQKKPKKETQKKPNKKTKKRKLSKKVAAEHKAWQIFKSWQKKNASKILEGQEITSLGEFKEIYNSVGRRIEKIKSLVQFKVKDTTFKAFNTKYKSITGKWLPTSARKKSTQELADTITDAINKFRNERIDYYIAQGDPLNVAQKKASLAVSEYFFGS